MNRERDKLPLCPTPLDKIIYDILFTEEAYLFCKVLLRYLVNHTRCRGISVNMASVHLYRQLDKPSGDNTAILLPVWRKQHQSFRSLKYRGEHRRG